MICALDLAMTYEALMAASRRGDSTALSEFERWLNVFWIDSSPASAGEFVTLSRTNGERRKNIRWSESKMAVYGMIPGEEGCYRVPSDAFLPGEHISNHRQLRREPTFRDEPVPDASRSAHAPVSTPGGLSVSRLAVAAY